MRSFTLASLVFLIACGGSPEPGAQPAVFETTMPEITLEPGEELNEWCQTWRLGNREPMFVNRMRVAGDEHWHHSNWYVVTADYLSDQPAETWDCRAEGMDTLALHLDGRLLFAQTVGSAEDEIRLPADVALPIPADALVVGNIHVLNTSGASVTTSIDVTLETIPPEAVNVTLNAFEVAFLPLEVPPMARSSFSADCNYDTVHQQRLGRPLDFRVHYLMPHYHALGTRLTMRTIGGPEDGRPLLDTETYGEPAGTLFDPPVDFSGATGWSFACDYDNPTADTLGWGGADEEMCLVMGWLETELVWTGGVFGGTEALGDTEGDGVLRFRGDCLPFAVDSEL